MNEQNVADEKSLVEEEDDFFSPPKSVAYLGGLLQDELREISASSTLSADLFLMATMEAAGMQGAEIATYLGRTSNQISRARNGNAHYQEVVKMLQAAIARKIVSDVADLGALFDSQVRPSIATLMEVRDNLHSKDSDRLKAAMAFLDRAPSAPKASHQVESKSMIISFPVQVMENMRGALVDEGSTESQELLGLLDKIQQETSTGEEKA